MSHCLLLNQDHQPISVLPLSVINWQHAIKLMVLGRVHVLETYPDWIIHSERLAVNVPSVAVTREYFHFKKNVRFSRHNLYLRDLYQCQYCGDVFDYDQLTIDHVIPRSAGGHTSWTNCVTSCKACNYDKGSRLMKPLRPPHRPDYYKLADQWRHMPFKVQQPGWHKYLGLTDQVAA